MALAGVTIVAVTVAAWVAAAGGTHARAAAPAPRRGSVLAPGPRRDTLTAAVTAAASQWAGGAAAMQHRRAPQARTPSVIIAAGSGGSCYVGVPRCSETPCVQYAADTPAV